MLQDLTKFNTLYHHLLFLNKNKRTEEFIESYRENFGLILNVNDVEDELSLLRKKIIIKAHYANKLFELKDYSEAKEVTEETISFFDRLSEKERESTSLYHLMQYNLAKICYKLKDFDSSYQRFVRLKELYPERKEYLNWILILRHQKNKKLKYLLAIGCGLFFGVSFSLFTEQILVVRILFLILAISCCLVIVYQEWKFNRIHRLLNKKSPL